MSSTVDTQTSLPQWSVDGEGNSVLRCETDEIVIEARVILGGNGKWTRYVAKSRLGRPKKRGLGRIASTAIRHEMPPQVQTRDEAITWCESVFLEMKKGDK